MKSRKIIVFTDGSCIRKKGQDIKCGYGIHFPNEELDDISKTFPLENPTNQRAELYAIYRAIKKIISKLDFDTIEIYTDSQYSINSLTVWIDTWKENSWQNSKKESVANQDIIKKIDKYLQMYTDKIKFHHVRSHTNKKDFESIGNDMADRLARAVNQP